MIRAVGFAALVALGALGCGRDRIVVGAKNFTEQRLVGELLAQTIERAGLRVERRFDLGGSFVCDAALRAGQLDVYVEYTGTALTAILKLPPASDATTVLETVRGAYAPAGLVWTEPLGFDNTFALVVRPEAGVRTISAAVDPARSWTAAFGYEFQQRPDGYPALERTYGLAFRDIRTMDLGLLYRALADRKAGFQQFLRFVKLALSFISCRRLVYHLLILLRPRGANCGLHFRSNRRLGCVLRANRREGRN